MPAGYSSASSSASRASARLRQASSGSAQSAASAAETTGSPSAAAASRSSAVASAARRSRRVELGREPLRGDRVEPELAVRIAARGEHEEGTPARPVQLGLADPDIAGDEPDEHDEQLARAGVEAGGLELL